MTHKELRRFGRHAVWTDAPDLLRVQFDGLLLGRDLRAALDYRNDWAQDRARYFLIADLTRVTSVDSEARQVMIEERAAADRRQVTILFGASFGVRVIAQMMFRSLRILRPNVEHTERVFVGTEAEAFAYVEKCREEANGS